MNESAFDSAISLIEDALALVKRADSGAWLIYTAGIVPFFALLLFEVTDLAQNPFALINLAAVAGALALSYVWLHVCQSIYCGRLEAMLTEKNVGTGSLFRDAFAVQTVLAPGKLIMWPLALGIVIPHAAVTMFYQHSLIPQKPGTATLQSAIAEAKCDAVYRRNQAIWVLLLIFLLRAILWLNLLALLLLAPALWKTLTGFEGQLTRSPELLLNPTALVALCAIAYIGLDPVVKACCVLRRFARQSQASGLDLRLRLSVLRKSRKTGAVSSAPPKDLASSSAAWRRASASFALLRRAAAAAAVCFSFCVSFQLRAVQAVDKAPVVSSEEMHRAIEGVFHDPRNSWDLPVVQERRPAPNAFVAFMDSIVDWMGGLLKSVDSAIRDVMKGLRRIFSKNERQSREKQRLVSKGAGWIVIGCFSFLLVVAFTLWRRSNRPGSQLAETKLCAPKPIDIGPDETSALEKPADEWLRLAEQYRAAGDLRLALRALYLATLAALGRNGLLSLARGKSNLDYLRELRRRARRLDAGLIPAFETNVGLFEASWYGEHTITEEILAVFERNASLLRASA